MQSYLPMRKTCLKSKQDILQTERILIMPEYKKVGYLTTDFKMFHLKDEEMRSFHYHYHDFHKKDNLHFESKRYMGRSEQNR